MVFLCLYGLDASGKNTGCKSNYMPVVTTAEEVKHIIVNGYEGKLSLVIM